MIHHLLVWIERGTHVRENDTNCFPTWKQREADTKVEKKMAGQSVSLRTNINMDEGSISIGKHTKFWVLVSTHSVEISWFSLDGHQRFFFRIQNAESRLLNSISSHDHGLLFWVFPFLFWLIFNQILRQQQLRVSCVVFLFLYFFPLRLRFREVNHLIKGCGGQVLNKRETSPSKPTTDTFAFFFFFRKLFQRERATNQQMSFLSFFFFKRFSSRYIILSPPDLLHQRVLGGGFSSILAGARGQRRRSEVLRSTPPEAVLLLLLRLLLLLLYDGDDDG